MINAQRHTLFGAEYGISRPGQANLERGASSDQEAAQAGAKLLGIRPVCDGVDNTRPNGTAYSHAGMVR